jgi:hypothetical protein
MPNDAYRSRALSRGLLEAGDRPFGSQHDGQSALYLIYLPILLMLGALVAAIAPSNAAFVFGAIVGGLVGLHMMFNLLFNDPPLRISHLLAMSLLVAYNLGAANSWLTVPRASLTISEAFAKDPVVLANGIAASMAACAVLIFAGELWEKPIFGREFRLDFDLRSLFFIVLTTAAILIAFAIGDIGFMGAAITADEHVSAFGSLVTWLSAPCLAYSICATLNTKGAYRLVVGACALVQIIAMIPTGRRNFAFALVLSLVVCRLGRFRLRLSFYGKAVLLMAGFALVAIASIAFLYLRFAGYEHKEATSFGARFQAAEQLFQTRSVSEMAQLLQANVSTRTFEVAYFADLVDASQSSRPLLGKGLVTSLQLQVPSAISEDKFGLERYEEEQLVDMQFGFTFQDEANTILTAGAADFGLLGVFVYPLVMVALMRAAVEVVQAYLPTYVAAIIAIGFVFLMLLAETPLAGYFTLLRNATVVTAIFYLFSLLPRLSAREAGTDGMLVPGKLQRSIKG